MRRLTWRQIVDASVGLAPDFRIKWIGQIELRLDSYKIVVRWRIDLHRANAIRCCGNSQPIPRRRVNQLDHRLTFPITLKIGERVIQVKLPERNSVRRIEIVRSSF